MESSSEHPAQQCAAAAGAITEQGGAEIHRAFIAACDATPGATALIDARGEWTYHETLTASMHLARHLAAQGVMTDDIVIVTAERCASFVVCLLGIMMAGARVLVHDPRQLNQFWLANAAGMLRPRHRLVLQDTRADDEAVWNGATAGQVTRLPQQKQLILQVLRELAAQPQARMAAIPASLDVAARAYLVATSGTTNTPKIVSTRHRAVVNFLQWYVEEMKLCATDRFSLLSGLSHDPVVRDVFAPLSIGASLHIPSDSQRSDPEQLLGWIRDHGITVMHLTPAIVDSLAHVQNHTHVPSVRMLACGGDLLRQRHVTLAQELFPAAELINFYGATETPQAIAFHRVRQHDVGGIVPIGSAVRGWQLRVLDQDGEACAAGVVGEIHACSAYLAEGYVGLPLHTQQRFVPDPFSADPHARMFRTGDLGVVQVDGSMRVLGRNDRQVKIDGNRVDLADVEAEMEACGLVKQAAALFDPQHAQITAYVVLSQQATVVSEASLRAHFARGRTHMMPARIVTLASVPMTANGKTDYAALQALQPAAAEALPIAESSLYELLRTIWSEELGVTEPRRSDTFQELGGNSLRALRIAGRIQRAIGAPIRAMDLFIYPTLNALESFLRAGETAAIEGAHRTHDDIERRRRTVLRLKAMKENQLNG